MVQRNLGSKEIKKMTMMCSCSSMETYVLNICVSKRNFFKAVRKPNISSDQNIYFSRLEEYLTLFHTKKIRLNKYLVRYEDKIGDPQLEILMGCTRDQD